MKKIITLFLGLIVTMGFSQNNPIDFEAGGFGAAWTWTVFENGPSSPPLEIIANPDPNGINTSATVAKFTAKSDGNPWAGVESQQGVDLGTFTWNDNNRIVKIMVWKSVISDVGIKFATETGWAQLELKVSNTLTNEWEELTFDFSNAINPPDGNGTLGQIIVFPDFAPRTQDNIVYFDNITFNPAGDTPSDEPTVAAPTPPARDPDDVLSIFSDAYTDVAGTNFNPGWGQSTQVSFVDIDGNETLKYANFNYQGTEFASALNVTEMETLHLDMWTADATSVNIFLISPGPVETAFALPITPNQWISYDIPLTAFTGVNLADVIQFKFDGGNGSQTLYLDNLYFYKEDGVVEGPRNPIDFEPGGFGADWTWTVFENGPSSPPLEIITNPDPNGINTSATVAKFTAKSDGNPWAGVESQQGVDLGTFEWSDDNRIVKIMVWKSVISDVGIKFATETGWAQLELKVSNTLTNEWEELTFDFSNAINPPDGNGTLGQIIVFPDFAPRTQDNIVYFDNITFNPAGDTPSDEPTVAAPTPPARDPEDVLSIFSDAYTDVAGTNFNPGWGQTTQVSFVEIEGNETMKYANFNYQGTQFASALNVTEMETLHLDMWTADATSVNIFLISPGPVETAFALPITPNQWVSYDIPLTAFAGVNLADVIQFKFDGGNGSQTLYLDNLYFYKEDGEEGTDASLSDLQVDGTTVSGFSPSVLNYSVVLPEGTTVVPTVTATTNDPDASAVVTPADAIPGTTSILVTSANTEVERTYTVAFSIETGVVEGPRNPIDFEPDGYGADWTWTVFENQTNPPLEIIPNPDPSGINTSATVAKFTALEAGNPWAGVESQQGVDLGTFEWDDDNRIVKIHVWKSVISDVGIKFASETGWAQLELKVSNTLTNEWEELTFDFSNAINPPDGNGTLGQIIIFPDFDLDGREQDNIVYFDNITFGEGGVIPSDEPETAAPAPPARNPEDVVSVFSHAYTNVPDTDFNPNWGQSTMVSIVEIEGNETLKYANFNYQGTQFADPLNVTEMETLHLDMWTADATSVNVFLISTGPEETPYALPITPNQWVSYDIPLSEFTGVDLADVIQFKFDGGDGSPTIYLDNLYFYRAPTTVSVIGQNVLHLYPNPVKLGSQVRLSAVVDQIEVYDLTGKLILSSRNTSLFNTDGMKSGIYMVRIHELDGTIQMQKLVVN